MDISIIVPVYNEDESLPELSAWIKRVLDEHKHTYEVIMVDDGSTDKSWEVINKLHQENNHIKGIQFRRNYGKSAALNVGFHHAAGKVVVTMDADLQDSPDELPELYTMIMEGGFDLVSGWKAKRYDPITKTIPTKLFNWATRKMSGIELHDFNCGLKAYKHEVVKNIEVYGEMHRYIPVIAKWAGFKKIGEKEVVHQARKYGVTKFGLSRFMNGFLDLLSIFFVGKFGKRPMHFFGFMGGISFLIGFALTIKLIWDKVSASIRGYSDVRDIVDKPLFYLALTAIIIGVQLFLAGFIGELVSRNSTDRNYYALKEKLGV
ncbi:MAG: glycosyltransferase family 2 protein [Bacteroidota bacterium]|nr:glycosyltransferase family 2 protein [Bacteroidota bacterium]